jgi:hypothetical protein
MMVRQSWLKVGKLKVEGFRNGETGQTQRAKGKGREGAEVIPSAQELDEQRMVIHHRWRPLWMC